jgi:ABC-2 type transport system ATP-binding protein
MIEVNAVSKRYGQQTVLDHISLSVPRGEIFGLLGPSGAGKTTLIRLITGAEACDEGVVTVAGERSPSFKTLRHLGYMPQNDGLYTEVSGADNLAFFGGLFGLRGAALRRAIAAKLDLVGLTADAGKLVQHYSGGMKKRLSLAAALLHDPPLLILDEPTVGIDPLLRRRLWLEFARQRSAGVTLVVTTHVMDEIANCDRAALINNGRLLACGPIDALAALGHGNIENLFFAQTTDQEGTPS